MPSITYAYAIGTEVFHVGEKTGVRDAIVRALSINVTQAGSVLSYDIAFKKPSEGTSIVPETSLYDDVDLALAAYKLTVVVV